MGTKGTGKMAVTGKGVPGLTNRVVSKGSIGGARGGGKSGMGGSGGKTGKMGKPRSNMPDKC